jgi:hypothetical protein
MELQLEDFALAPLIEGVAKTVEPLARISHTYILQAAALTLESILAHPDVHSIGHSGHRIRA